MNFNKVFSCILFSSSILISLYYFLLFSLYNFTTQLCLFFIDFFFLTFLVLCKEFLKPWHHIDIKFKNLNKMEQYILLLLNLRGSIWNNLIK